MNKRFTMQKLTTLLTGLFISTSIFASSSSILDKKAEEISEKLTDQLTYAYLAASLNCRDYIKATMTTVDKTETLRKTLELKLESGIKHPPEIDAINSQLDTAIAGISTAYRCQPTEGVAEIKGLLEFDKYIFNLQHRDAVIA